MKKTNFGLIFIIFLLTLTLDNINNRQHNKQQNIIPKSYISFYESPEKCSFWTCFKYGEFQYEENPFEQNSSYGIVNSSNIVILNEALQQFEEEGHIEKVNFNYKTQLKKGDYVYGKYNRNKNSQSKELNYFLITYFDTENNILYYFSYDNRYNK